MSKEVRQLSHVGLGLFTLDKYWNFLSNTRNFLRIFFLMNLYLWYQLNLASIETVPLWNYFHKPRKHFNWRFTVIVIHLVWQKKLTTSSPFFAFLLFCNDNFSSTSSIRIFISSEICPISVGRELWRNRLNVMSLWKTQGLGPCWPVTATKLEGPSPRPRTCSLPFGDLEPDFPGKLHSKIPSGLDMKIRLVNQCKSIP